MSKKDLSIADLPDLRAWAQVPILTLEQAALIFSGIDPAFCPNGISESWTYHPRQAQQAAVVSQAIAGGVVLKTLSVYELYLFDCAGVYNGSYLSDQAKDTYSFNDIDARKTTVMTQVLLEWARKTGVLTMRQILKREQDEEQTITAPPEQVITVPSEQAVIVPQALIEYRPLEPRYKTPEFEAACEVVSKFWNELKEGAKPTKEIVIQEFIRETLRGMIGDEPSRAAVERIDTLTRPIQYKNTKRKESS